MKPKEPVRDNPTEHLVKLSVHEEVLCVTNKDSYLKQVIATALKGLSFSVMFLFVCYPKSHHRVLRGGISY